jgi:hypothetical protein
VPAAERAGDDLERVNADLRRAHRVAGVEVGGPWSSKYIVIVIPKKRLIVGTSRGPTAAVAT